VVVEVAGGCLFVFGLAPALRALCRQKQDLWPGAGLMSRARRLQQGRGWPSGHSVNHQRLENLLEEGLFTLRSTRPQYNPNRTRVKGTSGLKWIWDMFCMITS
jgi:hypothetical protein